MDCSYCDSSAPTERSDVTMPGYHRFRCGSCERSFNEWTGLLFNCLPYPPDVICLIVLWRVRDKLSLHDLTEVCLARRTIFTHEALREWEAKLAPALSETLREQRRGKGGDSGYADETYVKVKGRWVSLYHAIDRDGNLVDVLLSETRGRTAAEAFFRSACTGTGSVPARGYKAGRNFFRARSLRNRSRSLAWQRIQH